MYGCVSGIRFTHFVFLNQENEMKFLKITTIMAVAYEACVLKQSLPNV